jgi:hypothetical protein
MTYRYAIYDIEKSLKKNFDDADITLNQILYWVMVVANKIRASHNKNQKTDLFTSTYCPLEVKKDSKGRKYIDLPVHVMDLPNNGGIVYVAYDIDSCSCATPAFAQTEFEPVNVGEVKHLYMDEYTKPSSKQPYFYRLGDKVNGVSVNRLYLLGIECVEVESLEVAVKSTLDPKSLCDLDEEIPIPNELMQDLITEVLQLGRFVMMIPEERVNLGEDGVQMQNYRTPKVPESQDYSNENEG